MRSAIEAIVLPLLALAGALLLFGVFVWFGGVEPARRLGCCCSRARSATAFSWQNTLQRAAPLMLTALAVALPARAGLVVIGGEGALVLGALGCAALPYAVARPRRLLGSAMVLLAGALLGARVARAGRRAAPVARRQRNDLEPAARLHRDRVVQALRRRPAARPGEPEQAVDACARPRACASAPSLRRLLGDVHWGLVFGVVACVVAGVWLSFTSPGFCVARGRRQRAHGAPGRACRPTA